MADQLRADVVAAWVNGVLAEYAGRYEVVDHLFVRDAVRVVTVRRDAFFDIPRERWIADSDAERHGAMGEELRQWARRVMPA
ncbi:MAG: hypothetical protein ACM3NQ_11465 [Bacteroidales bacterium]